MNVVWLMAEVETKFTPTHIVEFNLQAFSGQNRKLTENSRTTKEIDKSHEIVGSSEKLHLLN